jgi:hypothetical protein
MKLDLVMFRAGVDRLKRIKAAGKKAGAPQRIFSGDGESNSDSESDSDSEQYGRSSPTQPDFEVRGDTGVSDPTDNKVSCQDLKEMKAGLRKNGPIQYTKGSVDQIIDVLTSPASMSLDLMFCNFVNRKGGLNNRPADEVQEEYVRNVKAALEGKPKESSVSYARVVAFCEYSLRITDNLDEELGRRVGPRRRQIPTDAPQVSGLLTYLDDLRVWSPRDEHQITEGQLRFIRDPWMEIELDKLVTDSYRYLWEKQKRQNLINSAHLNRPSLPRPETPSLPANAPPAWLGDKIPKTLVPPAPVLPAQQGDGLERNPSRRRGVDGAEKARSHRRSIGGSAVRGPYLPR